MTTASDPILEFAQALGGRVAVIPDWRIPPGQTRAVMSASYCVEANLDSATTSFTPVTPACSSVRELRDHCAAQMVLAQQRAIPPHEVDDAMTP